MTEIRQPSVSRDPRNRNRAPSATAIVPVRQHRNRTGFSLIQGCSRLFKGKNNVPHDPNPSTGVLHIGQGKDGRFLASTVLCCLTAQNEPA
jgi:hypothetical protein